jgi:anaerobic selenocysteine-containing dehydrogenase
MSEPERTVRSFCRVCTAVCGILVDVSGDEVVRVRGDGDHPFSHGYTCPKGRALPRMHHHPDRLVRPLVRVGDSLEPATWDDCLDDLAARLHTVIDTHGPESIGVFFGSGVGMDAAGYRMAEALYRALGTRARLSPLTIDGTAKVLVSDLVGGFPGLNPHVDTEQVKLIVYVGVNPVVSHGHTSAMPDPVMALRALLQRAEVWVVDPRRTETARLASRHLAPRPGTDYAVLGWLVRELLREGADQEALEHVVGLDALAGAVAPFTLEHAARVGGIEETELTDLLDAVRRAGRVAVVTGTGVTMSTAANVTQWLAWAVMILTGSMNRPGGVWFHPGFSHQLEAFELPVSPLDGLFGPGPRSRPESQAFFREWPCAALGDEIRAGNIRAVLNLGGHLVTAFPDANDLVPALRSLDVFATIEIIANEPPRSRRTCCPRRTSSNGPTSRSGTRWCRAWPRSTRPPWSRRSATDVRRGGCSRSSGAASGTSSAIRATPTTTRRNSRSSPSGRVARTTTWSRAGGSSRRTTSPRNGSTTISTGWAVGASRPTCSSSSSCSCKRGPTRGWCSCRAGKSVTSIHSSTSWVRWSRSSSTPTTPLPRALPMASA